MIQNLINHVAVVIDESSSMNAHKQGVISAFDALVAELVESSQSMNQETRISAYLFSDQHRIRNVIFDTDVLRIPSLKGFYEPNGWTALFDTIILSQDDLSKTYTKYGNHAFITYVITDGGDNRSRYNADGRLRTLLAGQDGRWTITGLVPDKAGADALINCGFEPGNIRIWDINSATGIVDVGSAIRGATKTFMQNRAVGVTKSTTLFAGGAEQVNAATIAAAGLKALDPSTYMIVPVTWDDDVAKWRMSGKKTKAMPNGTPSMEISDFMASMNIAYVLGTVFYRLEKSEKVDATKDIIVVHRKSGQAYGGREARTLIGLSDTATRIRPQKENVGEYDIYVKSTSLNRLLARHSKIIVPR